MTPLDAAPPPLFAPPSTIASDLAFFPYAMVSDGSDLFIVSSEVASNSWGGVWKLPVTGGAPTQLASGAWAPMNASLIPFLAVDDANVYFLHGDPTSPPTWGPASVDIASVPKAGGAVTSLFSSSALCAASVADGKVYWVETVPAGLGAAEAGAATSSTITVKSASLAAGAQVTTVGTVLLGAESSMPLSIAATGSSVFLAGEVFPTGSIGADGTWTPLSGWLLGGVGSASALNAVVPGPNGVYAYGLGTQATPLVLVESDSTGTAIVPTVEIWSVVADDDSVYWSASAGDLDDAGGSAFPGVFVMPSQGGAPNVVFQAAPGSQVFSSLAVDEEAVYWALYTDLSPTDVSSSVVIQRAQRVQ